MTRPPSDAQMARLVDALMKAEVSSRKARQRREEALTAAARRHYPKVTKAYAAVKEARLALETANLLRLGITPMQTVIRADGALWGVRLTSEGFARMVPLTKDLRPHKGRIERSLVRSAKMTILSDKVMTA